MKRFFTEHPATVGETYAEHFAFAFGVGGRMVAGGLACMLHAVLPEFCKTQEGAPSENSPCDWRRPTVTSASDTAGAATSYEPLFTAAEVESLTSASL